MYPWIISELFLLLLDFLSKGHQYWHVPIPLMLKDVPSFARLLLTSHLRQRSPCLCQCMRHQSRMALEGALSSCLVSSQSPNTKGRNICIENDYGIVTTTGFRFKKTNCLSIKYPTDAASVDSHLSDVQHSGSHLFKTEAFLRLMFIWGPSFRGI